MAHKALAGATGTPQLTSQRVRPVEIAAFPQWFTLGWNARRLAVFDRDVESIIATHGRDRLVATWLQAGARTVFYECVNLGCCGCAELVYTAIRCADRGPDSWFLAAGRRTVTSGHFREKLERTPLCLLPPLTVMFLRLRGLPVRLAGIARSLLIGRSCCRSLPVMPGM